MKRRSSSRDIKEKLAKDLQEKEATKCRACNGMIEFYWEPRYKGIRGKCTVCGSNWPAS